MKSHSSEDMPREQMARRSNVSCSADILQIEAGLADSGARLSIEQQGPVGCNTEIVSCGAHVTGDSWLVTRARILRP